MQHPFEAWSADTVMHRSSGRASNIKALMVATTEQSPDTQQGHDIQPESITPASVCSLQPTLSAPLTASRQQGSNTPWRLISIADGSAAAWSAGSQ